MNLLNIFLGEFLGTMMLIVLGNGVVSNILYKGTKGHNAGTLTIFITWGFAVMVGVLTAKSFTDQAGHLNPAVTMYILVKNNTSAATFFTFIGSQILGAAIGQIIVNTFYWNIANRTENKDIVLHCHANSPIDQKKWFNNVFAEFVGTIVLLTVVAVLGTSFFSQKDATSVTTLVQVIIVGFTIMVIGGALGGQTGYSINPARDLIPRIVYQLTPFTNKTSANWSYSWVPVFGPLLAGVVVGAFARLITL